MLLLLGIALGASLNACGGVLLVVSWRMFSLAEDDRLNLLDLQARVEAKFSAVSRQIDYNTELRDDIAELDARVDRRMAAAEALEAINDEKMALLAKCKMKPSILPFGRGDASAN